MLGEPLGRLRFGEKVSGTISPAAMNGRGNDHRFVTVNVAPPNKCMELTGKSVVFFARRKAKATRLLPAAHAGRQGVGEGRHAAKGVSVKKRVATCSCGQLSVECVGEPTSVSLCHCLQCQHRTGSTFGVAAFFNREYIEVEGRTNYFARRSEAGTELMFHFCETCRSTVYWEPGQKPELIAVAAGCFADPSFPAPSKSVFGEHQHPWVSLHI